jgi:hypothetical protein
MMKRSAMLLMMGMMILGNVLVAQTSSDVKTQEKIQEASQFKGKFYRLDYVLREMDGTKEISKRTYSVTAKTDGAYKQLRTGTRVPVITGEPINGRPQYQYMDVGINIDTQTREDAAGLSLEVTAELSSVAAADGAQTTPSLPPLVRQQKVGGFVPVTPGKSTLVFSADEPTSSRRFELSVTATSLR